MEIPKVFETVAAEQGWRYEDGEIELRLEDDRRQVVQLEPFEYDGEVFVRAWTRIGPARDIVPERLLGALRVNFGLPHGALAVQRDELVMRDTYQAQWADPGEVLGSLRYLAATADRFERTIFGPDRN